MIDVYAHTEAFAQALIARNVRVYAGGAGFKLDGSYETPVAPYAVLYSDGGLRSADSLVADHEEHAEFDLEVWSVGKSLRSAQSVQSDVLALSGSQVTVAGRVTVVRAIATDRVRPDRDDPRTALFQGKDSLILESLQV